MAPDVGLEPTT